MVSIVLVTLMLMPVFVGTASAEQESGSRYYIDLGEMDPRGEGYYLSFALPAGYDVVEESLPYLETAEIRIVGHEKIIIHTYTPERGWRIEDTGPFGAFIYVWMGCYNETIEAVCPSSSKYTRIDGHDTCYWGGPGECPGGYIITEGYIMEAYIFLEECYIYWKFHPEHILCVGLYPAHSDAYVTIGGQLQREKCEQVGNDLFSSIQISGPEIYIPYDPSLDELAMDIASQSFENFKNHKTVYFQEYLAYVVESKQKGETPISVDKWVLNKIEEVVKKEAGEVPPEDWFGSINSFVGTSIPSDADEKVEDYARKHPHIVVTAIVAIHGVEWQSGKEVDLKEVYGVKMPYKIHLSSFDFDINEFKMKKEGGLTRFLGKISKTWKGKNRETKFECNYNYDHGKEGYDGKMTYTQKFSNVKFNLSFSDALGATSRFQYTDDFWDIDIGSGLEELKIESKYFTSPWTSTSKILPDESNVHTIPVDSTTKIVDFYIDCREGDLSLYLYKPDGMKIDPSIALNDTNIGYAKNGTYEYYTVQSPDTGNWIMEVRAINVPTNGANYTILTLGWEEGRSTPTPGFEAIFAIAGLLAVAYLLRRRE